MKRYERQVMTEEFGKRGQMRLRRACVTVVGVGGLGSSVSIYLAAAGVGRLVLVDDEKVELSNLNRQVIHWEEDIGRGKVESAVEKLSRMNSKIEVNGLERPLNGKNVRRVVLGSDVVVDALDNYPARFLINEACVKEGIPMVHGAVEGFNGQVTTVLPRRGPCLRCILRSEPSGNREIPVLGPIPGIVGCIQATETIKLIAGVGKPLVGRMLILSGKEMRFEEIEVRRNPKCPVCGRAK